jgi:hypothetical protein
LDSLLTIHDRYCRLPSDAVNASQATALLSSAVDLARDYLDLRANLANSPGLSLPVSDLARITELADNALNSSKPQRAMLAAELVLLLSFLRNDIDAVMLDGQEEIRSRAERAFRHLQWSIAADQTVRTAWMSAFNAHETACEALGATHLLSHGIFAFKAISQTARTDLVFHEPIDVTSAGAVADGLVLTEWKRCREPSKINEVTSSAEIQADLYAGGVLGGRELRRVRYIVVVSGEQVVMPADVNRGGYVIRHINIPVRPKSPSAAAPGLAEAGKVDEISRSDLGS